MSIEGAKTLIFLHSTLDDAALSPNEFRVLAHLTRRAGSNGICKPGIRSIAKNCRIGKDTVHSIMEVLKERRFIKVSKPEKSRSAHNYTLTIAEGIAASVPIQGTDGKASVQIEGTDENPSVPIQGTDENPSVQIGTPHLSRLAPPICPDSRHVRLSEGYTIKDNASLGAVAPFASQGAQLPFSGDSFKKCWSQWVNHCQERKLKITGTQTEILFDKLKSWGEAKAIDSISHSIASGWQSIQEASERRAPRIAPTGPKRSPFKL